MKNKNKGNEITVIVPVYKASEELLVNAIKSVSEQKVKPNSLMFVVSKGSEDEKLVNKITKVDYGLDFNTISHSGNTNFAAQLNLGVEKCKTKWFIFLEQDDELSSIWVDNVIKYKEVYPDVGMFLPLVMDVNEGGEFLGFTNEAVWASQFSDELGLLDNAALLRYQNFNIDGMAMNKEIYLEYGGVKESIKLSFINEFLLRFTFNSCEVMVVPKLGYKHMNDREGGLFNDYKKELTMEESKWWLELAKKEFFHVNDRKIDYVKKNN